MNFSKNSWQTALYKYFWNTNKLPANLCPYFWKLVVMYICIIPYAIIAAPVYLVDRFADGKDLRDEVPTFGMALMGAVLYLAIACAICMVLIFFFPEVGVIKGLGIGGFVATGMGLLIWVVEFQKKRKAAREYQDFLNDVTPKEKKYVAVEFVRAKYNKYCPTITWE